MKKWFLVLLIVATIFGSAAVGGHAWLKGRFDRDVLVAELEKAWNCRVSLDSSEVSLLSAPAKVTLSNLRLFPRDGEAGKDYSSRRSVDPATSLLSVQEAVLHVTLKDLVQKTAAIEKLNLEGVHLAFNIDKEGKNPLEELFKKPKSDAPKAPAPEPLSPSPAVKKPEGFHAKDLYLALKVKDASLSNLTARIENFQAKKIVEIKELDLNLRDIEIDPNDLAKHNHCAYDFSSNFTVFDKREDRWVGDVKLTGNGTVKPFNVVTQLADPVYQVSVKVLKDSLVGGAPLSEQLSKKDRKQLEKYNMNLDMLALGGKLKEEAVFQIHGQGSKTEFLETLTLSFPQYDIQVLKQSWWNTEADELGMKFILVGDAELTQNILGQAQKALEEKIGSSLAALAQATVQGALVNEQGRLTIPLKAEGRLSKVEVRLDGAIGEIQDSLKDAGRSLLDGLFKNN